MTTMNDQPEAIPQRLLNEAKMLADNVECQGWTTNVLELARALDAAEKRGANPEPDDIDTRPRCSMQRMRDEIRKAEKRGADAEREAKSPHADVNTTIAELDKLNEILRSSVLRDASRLLYLQAHEVEACRASAAAIRQQEPKA
jgi:hypothetical protein